MIKQQLVSAIAKRTGTENHEATKHLEATMDIIMRTVANGEPIWLRGFGSFQRTVRKGKVVRSGPGLKVASRIPDRMVVVFKPADQFKASVLGQAPEPAQAPAPTPAAHF